MALGPLLALVATRAGTDHLPVQDPAVIDIRVRDVWDGEVPLVGAYSDYGWNHPGPLMFWAIAPLSRLTGGEPWATLVGATILQVVAIAASSVVAWRRGGASLVLAVSAAVALVYVGSAPRFSRYLGTRT